MSNFVQLFGNSLFTPKQFSNSLEHGCRLDKEGRQAFFPRMMRRSDG